MSESVHPIQDHLPSHLSSANQNPFVDLPCPCPYLYPCLCLYLYPFLYPYLVHRFFLSNHPIRVFLAPLVVAVHSHVHTDPFHNPVHQIDHDSRKGLQDLRGKVAGEEVVAQVGGMEIVDAGVMAVAKVLVQAVDLG